MLGLVDLSKREDLEQLNKEQLINVILKQRHDIDDMLSNKKSFEELVSMKEIFDYFKMQGE